MKLEGKEFKKTTVNFNRFDIFFSRCTLVPVTDLGSKLPNGSFTGNKDVAN